jgi:hypothetical protein
MNKQLADALVNTLPVGLTGLFNPWAERCIHDAEINGPEQRRVRLAQHLDCEATLILVGEAPGYQGCRYSGVGFTSERLLLEGAIPRVDMPAGRLTTDRKTPFSEPSATIVWKQLRALGVHETTVLWNALQMHPYRDGSIWSNRAPTQAELKMGYAAMALLRQAFPQAKIVAIGRKAEGLLAESGIVAEAAVRHPANGGANDFAKGLAKVIQEM